MQSLRKAETQLSDSLMATSEAARPIHDTAPIWITKGSAEYKRASWALFLAGFSSFALIYCVQPLLPEFKTAFELRPAGASLALSLTTGMLAIAMLISGALSQLFSRRGLMFTSMALAAVCNIAAATSSDWNWLLVARALEGIVLGGVPAVAMAYLAEEIEPLHLGKAMGLYVAGTAFGAMMGRVGMGVITEFTSWRVAMGVLGVACVLAAIGFYLLLPQSRNFKVKRGMRMRDHLLLWRGHLRNPALLRLYMIGFLLTSIFVTVFNYCAFRLSGEPYGLGQTALSMIFLTFAFGIVASSVGGSLADRFGRGPMLLTGFLIILVGVALTMFTPIPAIILGIALITTGFFIGHSAASGAVAANAGAAKSHASSLYLLFYYMGSSITGSVGGWFWQYGGWTWVAALTAACAVTGALLGFSVSSAGRARSVNAA